jgi:hypothetical protein
MGHDVKVLISGATGMLGQAMLAVSRHRVSKRVLESADIAALSGKGA